MIRKMNTNEEEVNKIMDIWIGSTIEGHKFISREYWLKNYETVKEKYIPVAENYVYLEEGEIKGFISILEGGYIGGLFVDIDYQGKAIGKQLIEHIKEIYNPLTLAVYKKNRRAVNFYKKNGFVEEYQQLNDETNETECIMILKKKGKLELV